MGREEVEVWERGGGILGREEVEVLGRDTGTWVEEVEVSNEVEGSWSRRSRSDETSILLHQVKFVYRISNLLTLPDLITIEQAIYP